MNMAEITAKLVNDLRAKTGQGMMECKKALQATNGDVEAAVDWFRKKGVKTSVTERAANEGRVVVALSSDAKSAAICEVRCNTDFAAKSDVVGKILDLAVQELLKNANTVVADLPQIKEQIIQAAQQTGENIQIGRTAVIHAAGKAGAYAHYTGKIGVLVSLTGSPTEELIRDLCLHITATNPLALTREQVPADIVTKEREIAVEQAKATGKPQNIAEKIAEGKMRTFYEERVLLDQKFVKDDSKTITQLLKDAKVTLEQYIRVGVGQ
jgi:elongation factor Ts